MGPQLFADKIFSYQIKGEKIVKTFDANHSLKQRVDTLIIIKNPVQDINGLSYKKVKQQKRDQRI